MFSLFKSKAPRAVITAAEVRDIIANAMEEAGIELHLSGTVLLADKTYALLTANEAFCAVRDSQTFYMPGLSDCDDTAWLAKARIITLQGKGKFGTNPAAFGVLWTMHHAVNVYINEKRQLLILENDGSMMKPAWIKWPVQLLVM